MENLVVGSSNCFYKINRPSLTLVILHAFVNLCLFLYLFSFGLCIHVPRICVFGLFFFFFTQCLLHCSWGMNSAIKHMNSNKSSNSNFFIIFLIVFNFQQNKQYPNAHFVFYLCVMCCPFFFF